MLNHDSSCHCVVVKTPKGNFTLQDDYAKLMKKNDRAKGLIIGTKVKGTYKPVNASVKKAYLALISQDEGQSMRSASSVQIRDAFRR